MAAEEPCAFFEEQRFSMRLMGAVAAFAVIVGVVALSFEGRMPSLLDVVLVLLPAVLVLALQAWFRLRTTVANGELTVQFPILLRRRIALSDIARAEAVTYSALRDFGGWGYRIGTRGTMINARGDRAVRLDLPDAGTLYIGSQRADELAALLDR